MSQENNEARIAALEKGVAALTCLAPLAQEVLGAVKRERTGRLEMCLMIMQWTVQIKSDHLDVVKSLADCPAFCDASERQKLLDHVARVQSVLERMEKIIRDGGQGGDGSTDEPPSSEP